MKYHFYTTSETAWDGLFKAMQSAQNSIYMEMYIFVDDTEKENDFISLLSEKARAGIRVRIVLDWFGSSALSDKAIKELENAGAEIIFFKKWFRRLHKKIAVVDEEIGFLGGVNIHHSARLWNDLLIRFEGPIVRSLVQSFRRTYRACGGKDTNILRYQKKSILGRTRIWIFEHIPEIRKPRLRDAYTEAILKAKERVLLVTPYFLPHKWLKRLITETITRGVKVEAIVPLNTDIPVLTRANHYFMNEMAENGVQFFQALKMNHAKLLLIDEDLALVGSQNIDALSFDFNAEVGVFFDDPEMIADLLKIVSEWKRSATIFTTPSRKNIADKLLSFLIRMLQPFL
jgi:cardiolipin synthase